MPVMHGCREQMKLQIARVMETMTLRMREALMRKKWKVSCQVVCTCLYCYHAGGMVNFEGLVCLIC